MGTVVFYDKETEYNNQDIEKIYSKYWFNLDEYYEYVMSFISNREDFQRGPQRYQFNEVRFWMQDNLEGEILVRYNFQSGDQTNGTIYLYFQHETDMMAFKLRWEE